jgi:putative transposase
MCEWFFGTLEAELLMRERFDTREQARHAIFRFIEGWYNIRRLHSSLGYRSPVEFEQQYEKHKVRRSAGCPPSGGRRGRDIRPAARPWTTREATPNGGHIPL